MVVIVRQTPVLYSSLLPIKWHTKVTNTLDGTLVIVVRHCIECFVTCCRYRSQRTTTEASKLLTKYI